MAEGPTPKGSERTSEKWGRRKTKAGASCLASLVTALANRGGVFSLLLSGREEGGKAGAELSISGLNFELDTRAEERLTGPHPPLSSITTGSHLFFIPCGSPRMPLAPRKFGLGGGESGGALRAPGSGHPPMATGGAVASTGN